MTERDTSPKRPVKPKGLGYIAEFITKEQERALLDQCNQGQWSKELSRRVQHYGFRYDYKTRALGPPIQPIPEWCGEILRKANYEAEQLIVNEYLPGQGIGKHTDSAVFDSLIIIVSLGSPCVMTFKRRSHIYHVTLERRSLVILNGEARWDWTHEIPPRTHDGLELRTTRISLTFRKIK